MHRFCGMTCVITDVGKVGKEEDKANFVCYLGMHQKTILLFSLVTLLVIILLFTPNISMAELTDEERDKVEDRASFVGNYCFGDGSDDFKKGLEPNPQKYAERLTGENTGFSGESLTLFQKEAKKICFERYYSGYYENPGYFGKQAADEPNVRQKCYDAGYDDGERGNYAAGSTVNNFATQSTYYGKFTLPDERQKYIDAFASICSPSYNQGYEKGEKETSDLALAREAGELLGIEEEDVVEYFGGEEGVKQAYEENCVIATASYGSPMAKEVQMLREIRDNQLLQTQSGSAFMGGFNTVYYSFAPTIAQWEQENPAFKEVVKTTITPLISSLSLLNHVSMDSEAEVLGYGISIILLNIGMYFVAPAAVVWQVKKRI